MLIIGIGVLVFEVTIFLKTSERAWWALGAPALGGYIILLLGLLFRDADNPLSRAADLTIKFLLGRVAVSAAAAAAIVATAILLAILLYRRDPPDGLYRVYAFSGVNTPERRVKDLLILFEVQAPVKHKRTLSEATSIDGVAEFPTHIDDLVTVRARDPEDRFYVIDTKSITRDDLVTARALDLAAIPPEDWLSPTVSAPLGVPISWTSIDPAYLQPRDAVAPRSFGTREGIENLAPLGSLPVAEIIISRPAYVVGYNPAWRQARWVAYEIRGQGSGVRRTSGYRRDPDVPAEWQASVGDYRGTGYDRGGLVSTADAAATKEMEAQLRYLTVIAPMAPGFNRTVYARLKQHTTRLKKADGSNRVFVIRGPAFRGEDGAEPVRLLTIGAAKVPVPTHFFQIAATVANGRIALECFFLPNLKSFEGRPGMRGPIEPRYRSSRAQIEAATGLRFFAGKAVSDAGCR